MDKLKYNYLQDLKKKELDCFERAKLIQSILDEESISIRELARQTDLKRSTIEDWLRWNTITDTQYKAMRDKGMTDSDVYRYLRVGDETLRKKTHAIDFELEKFLKTFAIFLLDPPYSDKTPELIERAIQRLSGIKKNIEKRKKQEEVSE